jgi:heme A synthase
MLIDQISAFVTQDLPFLLDIPIEVVAGATMILLTVYLLWVIQVDYRRARRVRDRTYGWALLVILFILIGFSAIYIVFLGEKLVMLLSNPAFLLTLLITISYVIYALYKRGPPYFEFYLDYP